MRNILSWPYILVTMNMIVKVSVIVESSFQEMIEVMFKKYQKSTVK